MVRNVIVLNADFMFLNLVSWKRAIKLVLKDKVEIIKKSKEYVKAGNNKIYIPMVVRLVNMVKHILRKKFTFSKKNVFIRDDYTCQYCGKVVSEPTIDHVFPVSKGGKTTWENCVTSCKKCNNEKGNLSLKEFGKPLRTQPKKPSYMEILNKMLKRMNINLDEIYQM